MIHSKSFLCWIDNKSALRSGITYTGALKRWLVRYCEIKSQTCYCSCVIIRERRLRRECRDSMWHSIKNSLLLYSIISRMSTMKSPHFGKDNEFHYGFKYGTILSSHFSQCKAIYYWGIIAFRHPISGFLAIPNMRSLSALKISRTEVFTSIRIVRVIY